MKKILFYTFFLLSAVLLMLLSPGCKKDNYPGASISPYIGLYDLRSLYKGTDITLNTENMMGSNSITGIVVSDHSGGNMPAGLLVVQDKRRLSELRGISIPLGAEAANYVPGDSVIVKVDGGVLKRVDGTLEITNISPAAVQRVSAGNKIATNRVPAGLILANPDKYESTLVVIVKGGFDPLPAPTDVLSGDKILNDGFGDLLLHTEPMADFAGKQVPVMANYYGVIFNKTGAGGQLIPQHRPRTGADVMVLSSVIEIAPVIITGFISDVKGGDGNYEYLQLKATRDIDFSATPFSVVITNNANASTPTGYPVNGWGTGGMRTFKFNLTTGFAAKGTFFYVGGAGKMINGSGSTDISSSNWVRAFNYTTTDGDGFGTKTGGLFANSGNASGIAVFSGTTVNASTKPVDVLFVGNGGSLFAAGPPAVGYRITNTDFYDLKNPITLADQPFYLNGSNSLNLAYTTADMGYFYVLGGVYSPSLGRWIKARTQTNVLLSKTSLITEIEGEGSTVLK